MYRMMRSDKAAEWILVAKGLSADMTPNHESRCCQSDIDLIAELLDDIPEGGQIVKLGANCPAVVTIIGVRPDIRLLSVGDGDEVISHEVDLFSPWRFPHLPKVNFTCIQEDALTFNYDKRPIDLLFLDSDFTVDGIKARLTAWVPFLAHPAWLLMHDWVRYPKVQEALLDTIVCVPNKTSEWSAAWRFE